MNNIYIPILNFI